MDDKLSKTIDGMRSMLTKEEYETILVRYTGKMDFQTNHYFDTSHFTLRAVDASLRIRERGTFLNVTIPLEEAVRAERKFKLHEKGKKTFELVFRRKKKYDFQDLRQELSIDEFNAILSSGFLPDGQIKKELETLIKTQRIENFMNLSTDRFQFRYEDFTVCLDKNAYCGVVDYDLEVNFDSKPATVATAVAIIKDLHIDYKRAPRKIARAWDALRSQL